MSVIPVRVALRIRPLSSKEIGDGCDTAITRVPGRAQVQVTNSEKAFTYDYAFSTESQQKDVYDNSVKPLVKQLFQGFNATVLAYGQTGSGKTFSMGTSNREGETEVALEGVIPRAVKEIFSRISELGNDYDFIVRVAFVELYKEKLYDLLSTQSKIKEDCIVDLREDPVKGVVIAGLTEVVVENLRQTMEQLEQGSVKRVTAATAMNNTSSRSHAIFTLYVEGTRKSDAPQMEGQDRIENIVSKFHLVDLAGSERAKKTLATGNRYQEGVAINMGLLSLGNVISALGMDAGPKNHIPYRDSKLTRLLQDSLGGNSHTLMIACVSPADTNLDETISTLRYADRARKIKNKPIVNQDGKDAENAKLRREIAELKVQIMNGGGTVAGAAGSSSDSSKEVDELKCKVSQMTSENRELTSALISCQGELSHLNEKLILTEDSNVKMKTKLEELRAETERMVNLSNPEKTDLENLLNKIRDVETCQKDSEKSLADHETTRFESANSSVTSEPDEATGEMDAAEALKQNALATQLQALNKQLAQKEQYQQTLNQQEEKLAEVRQQYEQQLELLESQLTSLGKEKDQLHQQNKAEPVSSKISEQRRKRIQELEADMQNLRKKVTEQQRMIKLNEKNEQKLKLLGTEIHSMKQAKVRLIRQMKEEAEKVRSWKMKKEKEVNQLKQAERKQQVQLTKERNLNAKQQNVLKRKMEEAHAANKRLKDVIDKQKAAKKMQTMGKQGLAGAAERMRNLVSQELDVVVSVKEAKKSREQLLKDRTELNKELQDLRRQQRITMTNTEREEMAQKVKDREDQLAMQNVQISELQKQIMDADSQENENQGASAANSKWWDTLATMTEAKIALQYLFEKAAESSANYSNAESSRNELKVLYDEAMKNTEALEQEISDLKYDHQEQMMENGKDYEERVGFLLKQLTSKPGPSGGDDSIKEQDIKKFSELQEALMKLTEDFEKNKKAKADLLASGKKTRNNVRYGGDRDESFGDDSEEDDDDDDEMFDDPDWHQTPLIKRLKKIRDTNNTQANKRGLGETFGEGETENGEAEGAPKAKRSSVSGVCGCKNGCKTKRCSCVKSGKGCSDTCKCPLAQCGNRGERDGLNSGPSSNDNTVLSDMSNNTTAGTMSLLNDTYQIHDESEVNLRKITPAVLFNDENQFKSPPAAPTKKTSNNSVFKSPFSRSLSPNNTPPPLKSDTASKLFKSPLRD